MLTQFGGMHLVVISGCKGKDAGLYSATLEQRRGAAESGATSGATSGVLRVASGARLVVREMQADFRIEIKGGEGLEGGNFVFRCHLTKKNAQMKWMRFGQVRVGSRQVGAGSG